MKRPVHRVRSRGSWQGASVLISPLQLLSPEGKKVMEGDDRKAVIRAVCHWLEKSRANREFFPAVKGLGIKEKMRTLNTLPEVK